MTTFLLRSSLVYTPRRLEAAHGNDLRLQTSHAPRSDHRRLLAEAAARPDDARDEDGDEPIAAPRFIMLTPRTQVDPSLLLILRSRLYFPADDEVEICLVEDNEPCSALPPSQVPPAPHHPMLPVVVIIYSLSACCEACNLA